jgi:hypothetical protein
MRASRLNDFLMVLQCSEIIRQAGGSIGNLMIDLGRMGPRLTSEYGRHGGSHVSSVPLRFPCIALPFADPEISGMARNSDSTPTRLCPEENDSLLSVKKYPLHNSSSLERLSDMVVYLYTVHGDRSKQMHPVRVMHFPARFIGTETWPAAISHRMDAVFS